jgi:hypothetical protein
MRLMAAAIAMIAGVLTSSLAQAHGDHGHHHHGPVAAVAADPQAATPSLAAAPAEAIAQDRAMSRMAGPVSNAAVIVTAAAPAAPDDDGSTAHCRVGCCLGTACAAAAGLLPPAVNVLPPVGGSRVVAGEARPMASLPTGGPRRPPRSLT